jgi:hypothetical protein|tara:strand:+ start:15278 stop:16126 length:849 start_codon:yes stop_codon:yes gene_type:complete
MEIPDDFVKIEDYRNDISRILDEIEEKCVHLKSTYNQYIKQTEKNKAFIMTLDTMLYQISLADLELADHKKFFNYHIYYTYGQYYKLYIRIKNGFSELHFSDFYKEAQRIEFDPFDDINFKYYPFENIIKIHNWIINFISNIKMYITKSNYEIEDDTVRVKNGISIDNLVFEKKHLVETLKNKIILHISTITKFYTYQKKVMSRIMLKIKLLYFQLDSDIKFETFSYNPRQSLTNVIDGRLETLTKQHNFANILMEEFEGKQPINPFWIFSNRIINKFLIFR